MANRLVRHSRRLYAYMGSDGGAVPWGALLALAAVSALGMGVGSLVALFSGAASSDGRYFGFMVAVGVWILALVVAVGVVMVANALKIEDDDRPEVPPEARRAL